jgi:hypothetical protein
MVIFTTHRANNTPNLPDRRWKEMRTVADDGLAHRAAMNGVAPDDRVRGEIYLFIVDLIAHEVDQLEQGPKRERGRALKQARRVIDLLPSDWTSNMVSVAPCQVSS